MQWVVESPRPEYLLVSAQSHAPRKRSVPEQPNLQSKLAPGGFHKGRMRP